MHSVYQMHLKRIEFIKKSLPDHTLVEMWSHDFNQMKQTNLEFKKFLIDFKFKESIRPRFALYGGRTECFVLYHLCQLGEKIKYFDFTSLYPYVQKYCEFPLGHPQIIKSKFDLVNFMAPKNKDGVEKKYNGLMYGKFLPPRNLLIPVLPCRINNKTMFTCCFTCATSGFVGKCEHSDEERAIEGVWVTPEIYKALEKGYKVIDLFEVWHFDQTEKYNKDTKSGGIFTSYVNSMLKQKQEASGWPAGIKADQEKQSYIKNYYENEGILLDVNKIAKNPGRRSVAKLMCNNQWGYLAMNTNKVILDTVVNVHKWYEMLDDDKIEIQNVDFFEGKLDSLLVYYTVKDEFHNGSKNTNVLIASFVTAYARLKLYDELEKLGDRLLYCDTDSMIFISRPGEYEPKLGDYLGELTDEISESDGNYIEEFVCAGPKNYALKYDSGKTDCTIKGFTLSHIASLKLNYESIKEIVLENNNKTIKVAQEKFSRCKKTWDINTNVIQKEYQLVFTKRAIVKNSFKTLPYGY